MPIDAHRWLMTAPGAPLQRQDFAAIPGPGEVVVAVAGCGVCHTDLGYFYDGVRTNQPLPLALGHEISGHVVAAGEGAAAWMGRAVIVPAVLPCGECDLCRRGLATICRAQKMPGNDIQGGFGSHIVVPARGLCPVDEARLAAAGLTLPQVSIVADALTTPYQAVRRAGVAPGDVAVVVGVGGVGGYCVQVARAFGAEVVAIDVDARKLDAIVADGGAALGLNAREHDAKALKKAVADFAKQRGLRATEWKIFECSGSAAGQTTAFNLLVHGATLSVVGFTMDKVEVRLSNLMAFDARALGNWGCPPEFYPAALDLVLDGKVLLAPFVETHPLAEINAVFHAVHQREITRRAVMVP
ncbi:MAG: 6-hydroxycyclohex-1-ene-1-carbonyl-CoA dehydrogenase [Rubrivivax sp.]|jgi:6-hydroxycyclohex-1-ene-1-carbonyl-CoA dehydrogenase|nr:6-hydroxycyclohex-1-ene-1-carbonyl-CoA dehydrogenase [Betaproteobacteria bacterium]MBP6318395.1 6-hydroxycyclohex-1-ene-1-carbonyl-CoA dehydrogenase [Rubrivivax sp.]MBK7517951.1 6-hydroxycyclohex-1-ene-1-carbonyl-CoA dehydrogenase [Betaproteobacteria bacterium]MBK8864516.1 6-hydroxycyclohex-1-ene-1-carbonyl-CoA dehydrogenase [Betaproteobacteria bacterium]MBL0296755.1 6-hydroxycyclohex-1-ene-1-carbonyl-CoA dehydrogenase [Betaproteobacteria bacterium]